jgi:plastocyanin
VPEAPPAPAKGNIAGSVTARPSALGGKNIIVYLADGPSAPGTGTKAELDQRGMAFIPLVTPIAAGGSVVFHNNDPFPHNIFTPDGTRFNLGNISRGQSVTRQFDAPGAYTLLCNLHPGMIAYILVTPSTYFTRADKDGRYSLQGVPSGTYKVTAWGPRLVAQTQTVTVGAGDSAADFQLQR